MLSPPKKTVQNDEEVADDGGPRVSKQLVFQAMEEDPKKAPRKRKPRGPAKVPHSLDLNIPVEGGSTALVPVGIVTSRVN